jgi:hypothetical protein
MDLRGILKGAFNVELNIGGGKGSPDEPVVLLDVDPAAAAFTQMMVLKCIFEAKQVFWTTLNRETRLVGDRVIEQFAVATAHFEGDEAVRHDEAYYFDVTAAVGPDSALPAIMIGLAERRIFLPFEIRILHFRNINIYPPEQKHLGVSFAYDAPGVKTTFYVYDNGENDIPDTFNNDRVMAQFHSAVAEFTTLSPEASPRSEIYSLKAWYLQAFRIGDDTSIVAVGVFNGNYFKVRITYASDPRIEEFVRQSLWDLESHLVPASKLN